ncbi:GNAT family N-acetyltransferase [Catenulispora yoronensis]
MREFRPDDLLAWQRIAGDPRVAAHTPWPALATPDTAGAWLAETARMAQAQPRRSFYLGLEYGDLIGTATLDILSFPHRQGEIGVYLRPDRWAEGLGTEAARLLLELAFSRLELHRVQATFDPRNLPGLRVAEHVKMRPEGVLLDRYLVAGQWQDRALYAITLPEWRGLGRQPNVAFEGVGEEPLIGNPRTEDSSLADEPRISDPVMSPEGPAAEEPAVAEPVGAEQARAERLEAEEEDEDDFDFFDEAGSAGASGAGEAAEPQMLTAQIVTHQIEVVEILPREP